MGEHGAYASMVVGSGFESELGEDAAGACLDGLGADVQLGGD